MKKIYISIPITGYEIEEVKTRAERVKLALMQSRGVTAVTPFDVVDMTEDEYSGNEDEFYAFCMGRDIEELLKCDAVFMCCGWQGSKGCRAEYAVAEIYRKEIIIESKINES